MDALATLLSYGLPYCLQLGTEMQLEAVRRGEIPDPDGAVVVDGADVFIRYDRIALEDNPHGITVRYYLGAVNVMWKLAGGVRLVFTNGQHRLELPENPGRVLVPRALGAA